MRRKEPDRAFTDRRVRKEKKRKEKEKTNREHVLCSRATPTLSQDLADSNINTLTPFTMLANQFDERPQCESCMAFFLMRLYRALRGVVAVVVGFSRTG